MARKANKTKQTSANKAKQQRDTQTLIVENRDAAHRIGKSLLRRSGIYLNGDEATSLFDLALCEAANSFQPTHGASILTWFFYNLRTELRRHIVGERQPTEIAGGAISTSGPEEHETQSHPAIQLASPTPTPEDAAYQGELRSALRLTLSKLDTLGRTVLLGCCVEDRNVAHMARDLKYSRSHLSLVKSISSRRLKARLRESLRDEGLPFKIAA